jgi:hypothetical protein
MVTGQAVTGMMRRRKRRRKTRRRLRELHLSNWFPLKNKHDQGKRRLTMTISGDLGQQNEPIRNEAWVRSSEDGLKWTAAMSTSSDRPKHRSCVRKAEGPVRPVFFPPLCFAQRPFFHQQSQLTLPFLVSRRQGMSSTVVVVRLPWKRPKSHPKVKWTAESSKRLMSCVEMATEEGTDKTSWALVSSMMKTPTEVFFPDPF